MRTVAGSALCVGCDSKSCGLVRFAAESSAWIVDVGCFAMGLLCSGPQRVSQTPVARLVVDAIAAHCSGKRELCVCGGKPAALNVGANAASGILKLAAVRQVYS